MIYYIIFLLLYPLLFILSFFRKKPINNLIIQTAKIGDYVNTSIMFDALNKTDIVIDKINYPFASNDLRIKHIYLINDYKINMFLKLKLAYIVFKNNYDNVYIVMPNSYNLFLGQMSFSKNKVTLSTYSDKWYSPILSFGINKVVHTVNVITLNSYLKLINHNYTYKDFKKVIQNPIIQSNYKLITKETFNIGISLTAANKLKTIDMDTWKEIFNILDRFQCNIYIFGLKNENNLYKELLTNITIKNSKIISLLGEINLQYLPFEISKMDLYISSDTGNSYIADAMNVPTINFAGPCFWMEQRPVYEKSLIIKSNASCVPYSSVFKTKSELRCKDIFKVNHQQKKDIEVFIKEIYITFQS
jgi:ADP-heptose:LPS heptosyltransferase